jgi:hypothetical protein
MQLVQIILGHGHVFVMKDTLETELYA